MAQSYSMTIDEAASAHAWVDLAWKLIIFSWLYNAKDLKKYCLTSWENSSRVFTSGSSVSFPGNMRKHFPVGWMFNHTVIKTNGSTWRLLCVPNRDGESIIFQKEKESTPYREKGGIICHFTGKWISTKFCGWEVWLELMHRGWAYTPFPFHVSLTRLSLLMDIYQSQLGVVTTAFLAVSSNGHCFMMMDKSLLLDLFPRVQ